MAFFPTMCYAAVSVRVALGLKHIIYKTGHYQFKQYALWAFRGPDCYTVAS